MGGRPPIYIYRGVMVSGCGARYAAKQELVSSLVGSKCRSSGE